MSNINKYGLPGFDFNLFNHDIIFHENNRLYTCKKCNIIINFVFIYDTEFGIFINKYVASHNGMIKTIFHNGMIKTIISTCEEIMMENALD